MHQCETKTNRTKEWRTESGMDRDSICFEQSWWTKHSLGSKKIRLGDHVMQHLLCTITNTKDQYIVSDKGTCVVRAAQFENTLTPSTYRQYCTFKHSQPSSYVSDIIQHVGFSTFKCLLWGRRNVMALLRGALWFKGLINVNGVCTSSVCIGRLVGAAMTYRCVFSRRWHVSITVDTCRRYTCEVALLAWTSGRDLVQQEFQSLSFG